ncbi:MAG: STAS domain-containing protein [Rhodospirillaceae bacterium]
MVMVEEGTEDGNGAGAATGPLWHTVSLPVVVESNQMPPVRDELLGCLQQGEAVRIDAREVCRISTAAIQVLVAAARTFSDCGVKLYYADPSDEFIEAFSDLGLYTHLADFIDISQSA